MHFKIVNIYVVKIKENYVWIDNKHSKIPFIAFLKTFIH